VVRGKTVIFLVVPSLAVAETARKMGPFVDRQAVVVNAAKGLSGEDPPLLSRIIAREMGLDYRVNIACLSGPNHAEEIIIGAPSATVVASLNEKTATRVQDLLMTKRLRVYTNPDLVGVELGGALKNIIAIGVGICDGLNFGDNSKAALMTRGLVEIARLGASLGARALTFSGLSGIGDLIVTCTSGHSRNRNFGIALGKGGKADRLLQDSRMVVEGYATSRSAYRLALQRGVEMPITTEVYQILYNGKEPEEAVYSLMYRSKTHEMEDLLSN
jgi:glycerol-3-phosphate dehydrogenase (NAD(P)+)